MDREKGAFREERFCYRESVFCRESVLFATGWPEIFLKESFQAGDREKNTGEEQRFERVNEHWREDFGAWGEARGRGGADSATYEGEFFGVFFLSLGRKV